MTEHDIPSAYVRDKRTPPPSREELRARIPGWGADLDPADRPSYPKLQYPADLPARTGTSPSGSRSRGPRERSIEHAFVTPVFGTAQPPKGLSGAIRRLPTRRFSEGRPAHWLLLIAGDRVDAVGGAPAVLRHPAPGQPGHRDRRAHRAQRTTASARGTGRSDCPAPGARPGRRRRPLGGRRRHRFPRCPPGGTHAAQLTVGAAHPPQRGRRRAMRGLRGARAASVPVVPKLLQRPATDSSGWPRQEPPWVRRGVLLVLAAVAGYQVGLVAVHQPARAAGPAVPRLALRRGHRADRGGAGPARDAARLGHRGGHARAGRSCWWASSPSSARCWSTSSPSWSRCCPPRSATSSGGSTGRSTRGSSPPTSSPR